MTSKQSTNIRLRATLTVEYDADPKDYDTADPVEMAHIDLANWQGDPMMLIASFDNEEFTVKVEPA
jgi:hypothetical protein